jgi:hypothetical protein
VAGAGGVGTAGGIRAAVQPRADPVTIRHTKQSQAHVVPPVAAITQRTWPHRCAGYTPALHWPDYKPQHLAQLPPLVPPTAAAAAPGQPSARRRHPRPEHSHPTQKVSPSSAASCCSAGRACAPLMAAGAPASFSTARNCRAWQGGECASPAGRAAGAAAAAAAAAAFAAAAAATARPAACWIEACNLEVPAPVSRESQASDAALMSTFHGRASTCAGTPLPPPPRRPQLATSPFALARKTSWPRPSRGP